MVTPDAIPKTCVCTPALNADLHTSLLFTTTDGAEAVGGALSVTTVDDTVFVSAATIEVEQRLTKSTPKNVLIRPMFPSPVFYSVTLDAIL